MPDTIRSRLLLLTLSVLVPALLGVAWLVASTYAAERQAHERRLADTARALSLAVDREIAQRTTVARLLAQSDWLDAAGPPRPELLAGFESQARRTLQGLQGWVELHGPDGLLLHTGRTGPQPATAAAPLHTAPALRAVVPATAMVPAHAAVIEPVVRDGQVLYNVVVAVAATEMQRLVDAQRLPEAWVGTVLDHRGHVVARQPGGQAHLGRAATPDLMARLRAAPEGMFESVSLDGTRVTGFYATAPRGWTYVTAMPRAAFLGQVPAAVREVVVGAAVLLALAVAGALWVGRRIAEPVQALKDGAARLQAGRAVAMPPTGLQECDEVAAALTRASRAIHDNRHELERQVAEAVARTRAAEQRISQTQRVEALGRLTGGVAHDVNNLLGVVSNSAHLMQRHPAAADLQAPLAATLRAVESGSRLTQHLMRFAGRRTVHPQRVALERALPEMQELLRTVLGRRVEVQVQVAPGTPAVHLDPAELELALVNLALNARDAMPQGGTLRLRAAPATADDLDGTGLPAGPRPWVLLTVGDDGVGIAPEIADRLFEPFFSTKSAVGAPAPGTGLGLSQVLGFCTQAGGTARLASTPGVGTTVSLWLPAHEGRDTTMPAAAASEAGAGGPRIDGARVLLVEDNEALSDATAALLAAHGARVHRAADAAAARALLEDGTAVDVVLTDVLMPGDEDGLALARRLRAERPALPVLLTTGYSTAASAAQAQGELVVLRKPCPPGELLGALHRALGRTEPGAAPGPGAAATAATTTAADADAVKQRA